MHSWKTEIEFQETNKLKDYLRRLMVLPFMRSPSGRFLFLILVLTAVAELLITFADPRLGILLHIAVLLSIFYNLSRGTGDPARRLKTALLLIPFIRVLSLALPFNAWPRISAYFLVSIPLFIAVALLVRLESWNREELGHTLYQLPLQVIIGLSGIALGWIEYQILEPEPIVENLSWSSAWLPALILLVSTGYLEELLFRGVLQSAAISAVGDWLGILFVASLFAVMHIGYASLLDMVFVLNVGIVFGVVVLHSRSILGVTLAHGLTNISLFMLWPFWLS